MSNCGISTSSRCNDKKPHHVYENVDFGKTAELPAVPKEKLNPKHEPFRVFPLYPRRQKLKDEHWGYSREFQVGYF